MESDPFSVLIVDDDENNRNVLTRYLQQEGHIAIQAANGREALALMRTQELDLVLLDIMMPEMDGYGVLRERRLDSTLRNTPVLVLSAVDEFESALKCIEMGAEDYLTKPLNLTLLKVRIAACLELKRLRNREQTYFKAMKSEQEKSERLLLNILPQPIAERLKQGQKIIADRFEEATVLFADIVDFTRITARLSDVEVIIRLLNEVFSMFDLLAELHGVEKIKTLGDGYMAVGGLPMPRADHAEAIADMALAMQKAITNFKTLDDETLRLRIGINTGSVMAGIIGTKKFAYDLWGETVNTAKRMESGSVPGRIQVTAATRERLGDSYLFEDRGVIPVKGVGDMVAYFLIGCKEQP